MPAGTVDVAVADLGESLLATGFPLIVRQAAAVLNGRAATP
jgi:hypothetical protein